MVKKLPLLAGGAAAAGLGWWALTRGRKHHPDWPELARYRYAHRGWFRRPEIPENSMAAFAEAIIHGCGAELDVHLTRDGRLAVIHDSSLLRTCGVEGRVEDLTVPELKKLRLEGTQEQIPLLEEVLALFEGQTPLIIELKVEQGNWAELCARTVECLDRFRVRCCIESFDPRALIWLRRNRPEIIRGQLSQNFLRSREGLSWPTAFALTNLLSNGAARPDFVAYNFHDRDNCSLRLATGLGGAEKVFWTLRRPAELAQTEALGAVAIFEQTAVPEKEKHS